MGDPIQEFYDKWTEQYHAFSSNPVVNKWRQEAISDLGISEESIVVDVGCGTGSNVPIIREESGDETEVVCVDISKESLSMIQRRSREESWDNVHAVRADGNRLPITSADYIFASFALGMFRNPVETVNSWTDQFGAGTKMCFLNVVKSQDSVGQIINKPLQVFTGLSVPADIQKKLELSKSGDALDDLDMKIRNVHTYLQENHKIISKQTRLNGCISWIVVEVTGSENV